MNFCSIGYFLGLLGLNFFLGKEFIQMNTNTTSKDWININKELGGFYESLQKKLFILQEEVL